jgi:hypothetical protein
MSRLRRQINVRLDLVSQRRLSRLLPMVSEAVGIDLSQSDLIRLALLELEKRYAPHTVSAKDEATDPSTRKGENRAEGGAYG